MDKASLEDQQNLKKALFYKYEYEYEYDKDNLDLMFASLDDPTQSMDSILNYIISNQGDFENLSDWEDFLDEVQKKCKAGGQGDKEITVASWRKFNRKRCMKITILFFVNTSKILLTLLIKQ